MSNNSNVVLLHNDSRSIFMQNASYLRTLVSTDPAFFELDVRLVLAKSDTERDAIVSERLSLLNECMDNVIENLMALTSGKIAV